MLRDQASGGGSASEAIQAYFRGDVAGCIAALDPSATTSGARPGLMVVLGSALATRGLTGSGPDAEKDLGRAKELFGKALSKRPALQLDRRFFSPRIVEHFEAARPR